MLKRAVHLTLRAAQGFIDSIFTLMKLPLRCPDYSCVSRRAKSVCIAFKNTGRGEIAHLVIDSTGLKVFVDRQQRHQLSLSVAVRQVDHTAVGRPGFRRVIREFGKRHRLGDTDPAGESRLLQKGIANAPAIVFE